MRIPKLYRQLIQFGLFGLLCGVLLALAGRLPKAWRLALLVGTVPVAFFGALILSFCVDSLDMWLRRRSRDPIWLKTYEGRQWLASEDGQKWQKERVK